MPGGFSLNIASLEPGAVLSGGGCEGERGKRDWEGD